MPRRAFRCVVDLTLNEVSAPGVWLPSREDVYLSVSLFGQYQTTQFLLPVFPLLVHEKFRFEKTYYTALDHSEVADYLNDELVIFELVQLSEYTDGAVRLASFSSSAGDFLLPFASHVATCSSTNHEILLSRTVAFPGISPKLAFSTKTLVKQSLSPELDALEDALEEEKERRIFKKTHRVPTRRAKSAKVVASSSRCDFSLLSYNASQDDPPPRYRQPTKSSLSRCRSVSVPSVIADVDLSDTIDSRPTFVVRKMNPELTGRVPGSVLGDRNANALRKDKNKEAKESKSKSKSKKDKEKKQKKSSSSKSSDVDLVYSSFKQRNHTDKVYREPVHRPPIHLLISDDEDESIYISRRLPRSRSASVRCRPRRTPPSFYSVPAEPVCDHISVHLDHPHDRIRLLPFYETSMCDLDRHFVPVF